MDELWLVLVVLFAISAGAGLVVYEVLLRKWGLVTAQNFLHWRGTLSVNNASSADGGAGAQERGARVSKKGDEKLKRLLASIAQGVERALPMERSAVEETRMMLMRAGWSIDPATWRGIRVISAGTGCLLVFAILLPGLHMVSLQSFGLIALAGVIGWMIPRLLLERSVVKRRHALEAQLPDAMELLGITMAAGSPAEQSFREVAENLEQPLAAEFEIVDREVNLLGHSREKALDNLALRCASRDISSFVAQLSQAISQGSSISEGLSSQAMLARETAQAAIIERIRKMPTKLDIVLSFCFLPPTVALVVVPTVVDLLGFLNNTLQ